MSPTSSERPARPSKLRSLAAFASIAALTAAAKQALQRGVAARYEEKLAATERALQTERERARRDPLTGCLNHASVIDELRAALGATPEEPLAVALIDVDGLKATNDLYGHQVGDAALLSVAAALQQDGAIVGRYGGDEFVVCLAGTDRDQAERYRALVLDALANSKLQVGDEALDVPIVASVGLATYPEDGKTAEELLKLADNAMYAEARKPVPGRASALRFESDRVTKLISDIVPLLTSKGTREEKLSMVAQHLSVGTGYDVVNIEVAGVRAGEDAEWEGTFGRGPRDVYDAWEDEQRGITDHPLSKILEETRKPVFIADLCNDELMTPREKEILKEAGLKSALVVPMIWQDQLVGMLSVVNKTPGTFGPWDAQFLTSVAMHVTAIIFMAELVEELQEASKYLAEAHGETVLMLAAAAEAYDDGTGSHLQRVRFLTEALARELDYNEHDVWRLGLAGILHDVGKIRVPLTVLTSPKSLTPDEWSEMRRHTIWGADLLQGRRGFELASLVARCHHERWDGSGYPDGLTGEEIPEAAAIVAVADAFDAMTSDRPYRAARPGEEAIREINACVGVQFSPRVVDALNRLAERGELPEAERRDRAHERAA